MDVIGLDYTVLPVAFAMHRVPEDEWPIWFDKMMVINHAQQEHRARKREAEDMKRKATQ